MPDAELGAVVSVSVTVLHPDSTLGQIHDGRNVLINEPVDAAVGTVLDVLLIDGPLDATPSDYLVASRRDFLLRTVQPGDVLEMTITDITDHSVHGTARNRDGDEVPVYVHSANLAWTQPDHPADIVVVGDVIDVAHLQPSEHGGSHASRTALLPDPLHAARQAYPPGSRAHGAIEKVARFGVFIRLDGCPPEAVGLLHFRDNPDAREIDWVTRGTTEVVVGDIDLMMRRVPLFLPDSDH